MTSVFVKVPVSERLPSESGYFFTIGKHGGKRLLFFDFETGFDEKINHWLEEIDLPNESDIFLNFQEFNTRKEIEFMKQGANFILNNLKGGK